VKKGNSTVVIVVSCELYAAVQLVRLVSLNVNARLRARDILTSSISRPRPLSVLTFRF